MLMPPCRFSRLTRRVARGDTPAAVVGEVRVSRVESRVCELTSRALEVRLREGKEGEDMGDGNSASLGGGKCKA